MTQARDWSSSTLEFTHLHSGLIFSKQLPMISTFIVYSHQVTNWKDQQDLESLEIKLCGCSGGKDPNDRVSILSWMTDGCHSAYSQKDTYPITQIYWCAKTVEGKKDRTTRPFSTTSPIWHQAIQSQTTPYLINQKFIKTPSSKESHTAHQVFVREWKAWSVEWVSHVDHEDSRNTTAWKLRCSILSSCIDFGRITWVQLRKEIVLPAKGEW